MNRRATFVKILFCLLAVTLARAADQYAVTYERNVSVKMRDGVTLHADIFRPQAEGKFPVLLQRTPYNKDNGVEFGIKAAARGYVVIFQDVRGRYASEGDWYVFKNEPNDGYDTVEWAAALTYSDGRVGMFGGSYLGGAFVQWFDEDWTSGLSQNAYERVVGGQNDPVGGIWTLPLTNYPILNLEKRPDISSNATVAPYFLDWLAHPSYDDYWKALSIEEHFADIKVPALHVAAWYDLFLGGSLRNYLGIKVHGGSEEARQGQQLVVVIGGHAGPGPKVADVDFGPAAKESQEPYELRYYDYLFKGV